MMDHCRLYAPEVGLEDVIDELVSGGAVVVRDVVVATGNHAGDLAADPAEFWFHTDGTHLPIPPRWIVIHVAYAEAGGELAVADLTAHLDRLAGITAEFDAIPEPFVAPIVESGPAGPRIRYRRDRMRGAPGSSDLAGVHAAVEQAAEAAHSLGCLPVGASLVVDNWRALHSRGKVLGERVIRRLWLDQRSDA